MSDRLNCPFCAGTDIRFHMHKGKGTGIHLGEDVWSTCCYDCGATFPNRYKKEPLVECWQRRPAAEPFQGRVQPWMTECFGAEIASDRMERNHRFFEESTETVQANGMTRSEAHQLVDYTYDRPVGDLHQEIGGVMVTLAALCLASGQDMHAAGETELARIWTKVEKIRAKQAAKPKHSPLPEHVETAPVASKESVTLSYPEELTPELREVLGWICFQCISVAQCLRADGMEIAKRAEDEQAAVLHWLTKFVLKHGAKWRPHAGEALNAMRERVAQRDASKAEGQSS